MTNSAERGDLDRILAAHDLLLRGAQHYDEEVHWFGQMELIRRYGEGQSLSQLAAYLDQTLAEVRDRSE